MPNFDLTEDEAVEILADLASDGIDEFDGEYEDDFEDDYDDDGVF